MTRSAEQFPPLQSMVLLSRLLLPPRNTGVVALPDHAELSRQLAHITREEFDDLVELANLNHVVIRGLEVFLPLVREERNSESANQAAEWAVDALAAERARIA